MLALTPVHVVDPGRLLVLVDVAKDHPGDAAAAFAPGLLDLLLGFNTHDAHSR